MLLIFGLFMFLILPSIFVLIIYSYFSSVFWDLYCAAPERRDTCEHSSEAKAFHDYVCVKNFILNKETKFSSTKKSLFFF